MIRFLWVGCADWRWGTERGEPNNPYLYVGAWFLGPITIDFWRSVALQEKTDGQ